MRNFLSIVAATALLCGAVVHAQAPAARQPGSTGASHAGTQQLPVVGISSTELEFMLQAARINHAEIEAAQLALQRARDPGLREFAQELLRDHRSANTQLRQIALSRSVALPTGPSRQHQRMLDALRGLRGEAFESEFIQRAGLEAHRETIALHRAQASRDHGDAALRNHARSTLKTLQRHLDMAAGLHAAAAHGGAGRTAEGSARGTAGNELADAQDRIREAIQVVQRMKADARLAPLLERAQGVFILPTYARAALGVGVQGGKGVLVTRQGEQFGNPVFYSMGGVSVGPQAGGAAGELALLLMTERAVQRFRSDRNFSLTADAGLTVGDSTARSHASTGKVQDVLVWSGTRGAYAGGSFGVHDIVVDAAANRAYYGRDATPLAILGGRVENPHNNTLGRVLAL